MAEHSDLCDAYLDLSRELVVREGVMNDRQVRLKIELLGASTSARMASLILEGLLRHLSEISNAATLLAEFSAIYLELDTLLAMNHHRHSASHDRHIAPVVAKLQRTIDDSLKSKELQQFLRERCS